MQIFKISLLQTSIETQGSNALIFLFQIMLLQ